VAECVQLSAPCLERMAALAQLAVRGLLETYAPTAKGLPYTRRCEPNGVRAKGNSARYALISLIGLAKGAPVVGRQENLVRLLCCRLAAAGLNRLSPGELGLALWARSLHEGAAELVTPGNVERAFSGGVGVLDSMKWGWVLLGADHAVAAGESVPTAERLASLARKSLLALYNPRTDLFYRHNRRGVSHAVSRRITCFANQIYPVMALAVHGRRTGCLQSSETAVAVADKLCELQGELGQWWWLYDAETGEVVERYPVFSVHQDAMAPMALLEAGRDHRFVGPVERGLGWLSQANELGEDMVVADVGLIHRDVHLSRVGRIHRILHGVTWCCGRQIVQAEKTWASRFVVNRECRPYHLGWILYAAGLVRECTRPYVRPL